MATTRGSGGWVCVLCCDHGRKGFMKNGIFVLILAGSLEIAVGQGDFSVTTTNSVAMTNSLSPPTNSWETNMPPINRWETNMPPINRWETNFPPGFTNRWRTNFHHWRTNRSGTNDFDRDDMTTNWPGNPAGTNRIQTIHPQTVPPAVTPGDPTLPPGQNGAVPARPGQPSTPGSTIPTTPSAPPTMPAR